jgi:hypothetical protein
VETQTPFCLGKKKEAFTFVKASFLLDFDD